jgi:hypothetical protein
MFIGVRMNAVRLTFQLHFLWCSALIWQERVFVWLSEFSPTNDLRTAFSPMAGCSKHIPIHHIPIRALRTVLGSVSH